MQCIQTKLTIECLFKRSGNLEFVCDTHFIVTAALAGRKGLSGVSPSIKDQMKPKYRAVFYHANMNGGVQFVGLTENQLIKTLLDQGVHTLSSLTHDDRSPGNIRAVEGKEMISIWKQVYKVIQQRKHDVR
jgi:hypothetical protein